MSNNHPFDFNPFHLLVLLVIFFFFCQNENMDSIHLGSRDVCMYIYIYEWKEILKRAKLITRGKNLSRIWFFLSYIRHLKSRVKNVSICAVDSELKYFQFSLSLSLSTRFKQIYLQIRGSLQMLVCKSRKYIETCTYIFDAENYKGRWITKDYIYIFSMNCSCERHAKRKNRKLLGGSWKKNYIYP